MHDRTITLFNLHKGTWYPSVIRGVTVTESASSAATTQAGWTGGDALEVSIKTSRAKAIETATGYKAYVTPKVYAACADPSEFLSFTPEQDFIYCGEWADGGGTDDDYDSGFYHAMNEEYDGVYKITSAEWLGALPHFEIGGR